MPNEVSYQENIHHSCGGQNPSTHSGGSTAMEATFNTPDTTWQCYLFLVYLFKPL